MDLRGKLAAATALLALPLLLGACGDLWDIPEDNPHPPELVAAEVSSGVVSREGRVDIRVTYRDAGADIDFLRVRDKESGTSYESKTEEVDGLTYNPFPGVEGTAHLFIDSLAGAQAGPHRLLFWLEDSKGSWSNIVEVTVTVLI